MNRVSLGGHIESDFSISLPLRSGLTTDEIKYQAAGKITGGTVQKLLGDHDAKTANINFHLDQTRLELDGPLEFSNIPLTLDGSTYFAGNNKGHFNFTIDAPAITRPQISALGYDPGDYLKGSMALKATAKLAPGGEFEALVETDFNKAVLSIPQIKWHKAAGEGGSIGFDLYIDKNRFVKVKDIKVELGDLKTYGNAEIDLSGSHLSLVLPRLSLSNGELHNLKLERTRVNNLQLSVRGGELDLESFLSVDDGGNTSQPRKLEVGTGAIVGDLKSSEIVFEIAKSRLDKVYINKDAWFDDIQFAARRDAQGWQELEISGHDPFKGDHADKPVSAGKLAPGKFSANYGPAVNGLYPVHIEVKNVGHLVSAIQGRTIMEGGYMLISGDSTGPLLTKPIQSTIEVDNFTVKEVPGISMVLNMASLNQLVSTFRHTGLAFNSLSGDLKLDGVILSSKQIRAKGGSLGLIGSGSVNLKQRTMDLTGTVVPLSNVNNVIGKIPLLGQVVVGSDGKGLMAVDFTIKGTFEKFEATVQKESLSPRLFKNIMSIGAKDSKTETQ